jgi:hypothetical protein
MGTTQTSYSERIPEALPGLIKGSDYDTRTGICETAAGIGFGLAVSKGVGDQGAVIGGASEFFLGISVRDVTLVHPAATVDKYIEDENMGILSRGTIWVTTGGAVSAGNAVHFNATTGVLSAAGGELLQGARWDTSAASGELAVVRLSGYNNMAAS